MKTMRHILTNEIRRVSDDEARRLINEDNLEPKCWQYIPKRFWKANEVNSPRPA